MLLYSITTQYHLYIQSYFVREVFIPSIEQDDHFLNWSIKFMINLDENIDNFKKSCLNISWSIGHEITESEWREFES